VLNNDNQILRFDFYDGTTYLPGAGIFAEVDGTPGTNDMPGRLIFSTTADGAASMTERMRIDASGNVGIGTSSPSQRLAVSGQISSFVAGASILQTAIDTANSINWQVGSDGANIYAGTQTNHALRLTTNNTERMRIAADGEVYIAGTTDQGAFNLQVNGTGVWGAGAYTNGSDARIKDDIAPIASGLDVVAKLRPVQFRYKESWSKDRFLQPGFIAQELQEALADQPYVEGVVHQGPEYMSVSYQTLIPVLAKAVQELTARLEAAEARIANLENR
jgi:hypothetical protein